MLIDCYVIAITVQQAQQPICQAICYAAVALTGACRRSGVSCGVQSMHTDDLAPGMAFVPSRAMEMTTDLPGDHLPPAFGCMLKSTKC